MKDIRSHSTTFSLLLMMALYAYALERDLAFCPDPGTINPKYGWQVSSGGNNPYRVGTVIQFQCYPNFKLAKNGQPKIRCTEDGTWTGKVPKCVAKSCLGSVPDVRFATPYPKCSSPYPIGCTVEYTCNVGYKPIHDPVKTCDKDGQWRGNFNCTSIECPQPSNLLNGFKSFHTLNFSSVVTYTCHEGYILKGVKRRVCEGNGQWSGNKPVCELYRCFGIDESESQPTITYSSSDNRIGTVATFRCLDRYALKGFRQRTCLKSGIWSGKNPTCISVECNAPSTPQLGKVLGHPTDDNKYRYGSVVTYVCEALFYLWGNSTRQCLANADGLSYWTGDDPECLPLTTYEERCKKRPGYHVEWSSTKLRCVHENYNPPTTGDVGKAPRSRELDTLTIVTACAGSTLGALVILLIVLVCVRKLHRTRRFRHAAFRSRRYSYDDDRVALIAAYARDVHFILPSYDEAINQVDRSPPPFESVVNRASDTSNNNEDSLEHTNREVTGEGQNSSTTSAGSEGTIHIVFNPMAERGNVNNETERASIIEIPTESHNSSEASPNQHLSEGADHDSSETVVDSRNSSTES